MNAAALMTEWGATDNVNAIGIDTAGADEALMGWTYWAYNANSGGTGILGDGWNTVANPKKVYTFKSPLWILSMSK